MIYGVGVDLLSIKRVERLYLKYGERFVNHVLTVEESEQFQSVSRKTHYLATRFSGKEAVAKALGTGLRAPVTLHSISIISGEIGKPYIFFTDCLKIYLEQLGVDNLFISFSHEGDLLSSYVIAERLHKK